MAMMEQDKQDAAAPLVRAETLEEATPPQVP